ncbi:MAG: F0F1 ATP synthase subunit A [Clostridia bacterium]|nr:F0F1 ATP synthase subunit A [Clostridia bacterium]MBP3650832.1 F0F1 ATP synthase subunit A [Clostridia bacterium]
MILPLVAGIALKVLTTPASNGIEITGARVYATIPMPLQNLTITESQINSWLIMLSILGLALYLGHGLALKPQTKRQVLAEWAVEQVQNLVSDNMGQRFIQFVPFIAAIMVISAFSSLMSLVGLRPPTADMNVVAGWAIVVFIIITYYKLKGGLFPYVKGFFEPVPVFAPFNIIGELATPVSMSFRHYGNVLSGVVISTLVAFALQGLSKLVLGWLPGFLGNFPFLQIGLPAILSLYFDIFSGLMQAFIFAMLTMLYIATGFPEEDYERRMAKKRARRAAA